MAEPSMLEKRLVPNQTRAKATYGGFDIHAGVRVRRGETKKRERLVNYVTRPPFSEEQLEILDDARVRLELRSPTKNGQSAITFDPVRFLRRVAWQIPTPRQNQIRYYGVFGATHRIRNSVVPRPPALTLLEGHGGESRYRVPWAMLISKVFDLDSQICLDCGGRLKPVGAVTDFDEARAELQRGILVLGQIESARDCRDPPAAA